MATEVKKEKKARERNPFMQMAADVAKLKTLCAQYRAKVDSLRDQIEHATAALAGYEKEYAAAMDKLQKG